MIGKSYYAYMVQCSDGSIYAGFSDDPVRRCRVHNSGKGAKYTRSRLPVSLVWVSNPLPDVSTAMSVEATIKSFSRRNKLKLIVERDSFHDPIRSFSGPIDYSANLIL